MINTYKTIFKDEMGTEETIIENDGLCLCMYLRSSKFTSTNWIDWNIVNDVERDNLVDFELSCIIPLPSICDENVLVGDLYLNVCHNADRHDGDFAFIYILNGKEYKTKGHDFELLYTDITVAMPDGVCMQACINCAYSDYSPYGNDTFGTLICYNKVKKVYSTVRSKDDYLEVFNKYIDIVNKIQEINKCSKFKCRKPGTGYRG